MYLDTRLFSFFSSGNQELRYDLITVEDQRHCGDKDADGDGQGLTWLPLHGGGEDKKVEVNPKVLTQKVGMEGIAGCSPFTGSSSWLSFSCWATSHPIFSLTRW